MRYELMFPDQIRKAIDENWPVALPVGVLEYHADHCAVGVDALVVVRAVELLEKEMDLVLLPSFYYGAASYAVAPPERNGTIQVEADTLKMFGLDLFRSLLRIGFRNVHLFFAHQTENFANGMPTDLAFKMAARQAIFEFIEKENGEGWWGNEKMQSYYADRVKKTDPFSWIQAHPALDAEGKKSFPSDHAGKTESSLMMALCPEAVDMKRFSADKWYARQAPEASIEYGRAARDAILARMRRILKDAK